jgi:hypothetical protein
VRLERCISDAEIVYWQIIAVLQVTSHQHWTKRLNCFLNAITICVLTQSLSAITVQFEAMTLFPQIKSVMLQKCIIFHWSKSTSFLVEYWMDVDSWTVFTVWHNESARSALQVNVIQSDALVKSISLLGILRRCYGNQMLTNLDNSSNVQWTSQLSG